MSTSEENKPLSRRELREREQSQNGTTAARRESVPAPAPIVDAPSPATAPLNLVELRKLKQAQASGETLTRRQLRDLERAESGALLSDSKPAVITEDAASIARREREAADRAAREQAEREASARAAANKIAAERAQQERLIAEQAAAAAAEQEKLRLASAKPSRRGTPRAERRGVEEKAQAEKAAEAAERARLEAESAARSAAIAEQEKERAVREATVRAQGDAPARPAAGTRVGASFGAAATADVRAPSAFEDVLARGIDTAQGSGSGTSALILPEMPSSGPLQSPIAGGTGEIIITGTIDLPGSLSNTGQHPNHFDKGELDTMFDHDEDPQPATAGNPVSASRAVSTHTATRDVIAAPTPAKNNRLLMILSITAGALAVAVVGVVITAILSGAIGG